MNNWVQHIGSIWAEILKSSVQNGQTIVEVAPGGTDKIGYALAQLNWSGRLFLVEPETQALQDTFAAYKQLLPNCDLIPIQSTLAQLSLKSFDILLANHPLDDMIIGNSLKENEFTSFFNDHYQKPIDLTVALWNRLTITDIQKAIKQTTRDIVKFSNRAKVTFISQYESYFFKSNGFTKPDDVAHEALKAIRNEINGSLFRNGRWLIA